MSTDLPIMPHALRPPMREHKVADNPDVPMPECIKAWCERKDADGISAWGRGLSDDPDDVFQPPSLAKIKAALAAISPDCSYNDWLHIGAALNDELGDGGLDLFVEWSQLPAKYPKGTSPADKWRDCPKLTEWHIATVFHMANPNWRRDVDEPCEQQPAPAAPAVVGKLKRKLEDLTRRASDLRGKEFAPLQWNVPKYIPEGLSLLIGKPKIGKSWLLMDNAIATATMGMCLGERCEQGDVLLLALEDTDRRLQRRIQAMIGLSTAWPERLTYATEWPLLNAGGLDLIKEWIDGANQPRLVDIDVLQRVREPIKGKESIYAADYAALAKLHDLAGEAQISMVVAHHQRKAGADDRFDTASGSFGLTGVCDSVLILDRALLGKCLLGRGRDMEEFDVAVDQDKWFRWRVLGPAAEVRMSAEKTAILNALAQAGKPMTIAEITDAIGGKRPNSKAMLAKMADKGEVERTKTGVYGLRTLDPGEIDRNEM